jgi:hypothetical protein
MTSYREGPWRRWQLAQQCIRGSGVPLRYRLKAGTWDRTSGPIIEAVPQGMGVRLGLEAVVAAAIKICGCPICRSLQ